MSTQTATPALIARRAGTGALAGIAGGIVFGMLMAMMGMLSMVAGLVGCTNPIVGLLVHLVISAAIGALFGALVPRLPLVPTLAAGAVYGMVWWVLGPLLIMPAWLGMPLFAINTAALMSLMGHVVFGLVTAAALIRPRAPAHDRRSFCLAEVALFQDLSRREMARITARAPMRTVRAGQPVFDPARPITVLFIVKHGRIRVFRRCRTAAR
jgi:hypothetical protein